MCTLMSCVSCFPLKDLWDDNGSAWSDGVEWKDLPLDAQQSAAMLGYDKETWDARVEAQREKNEEEDNKDDDRENNAEVDNKDDDDDKEETRSPTFMPTSNDDGNEEYVDDYGSMSMPESDMSLSVHYNDSTILDPTYMPSYVPTASDDDDKFDTNDRNEVSGDDKAVYEAALEAAAIKDVDDSR